MNNLCIEKKSYRCFKINCILYASVYVNFSSSSTSFRKLFFARSILSWLMTIEVEQKNYFLVKRECTHNYHNCNCEKTFFKIINSNITGGRFQLQLPVTKILFKRFFTNEIKVKWPRPFNLIMFTRHICNLAGI